MIAALAFATAAIPSAALAPRAEAGPPITVGFIYVGPKDDYGYNQAHAEGAAALAKLPGVKVLEEEKRPRDRRRPEDHGEHDQPRRRDGPLPDLVRLLRSAHPRRWPRSIPKVTFLHCGGLYTEGKHPKNVGSYFGYIDEAQYVSGIVAGLTTKTNKLGFVAAKPIPQVLRNINAFTLGARSVNPEGRPPPSSSPATGPCPSRRPRPPTA